ncbi:MAG: glucosyltransferase domain-containing protein [Oscillibacter sp.]|nr:glucosyltransferase domain-containing protein [Oscillibacter sp.]
MSERRKQNPALPPDPDSVPRRPPQDPNRRRTAAFLSAAICAVAAHGFLFANEFFSHDSVSYFNYTEWGFRFYTGIGRFLIPVYEACKGPIAAPWLIGILFTLWMSLTAVVVTDLLDIQTPSAVALAAGLLCTNVSVSLTGATYVYCMDEYAFALLGAAGAAFLFLRGGRLALFGTLPLLASLSIYQPYATVTAVLCLLALLRDALDGRRFRTVLFRGVTALSLLAVSYLFYRCLWTFLRVLCQIPQTRDVVSFRDFGPLARLMSANSAFFGFLFRPGVVLGPLRPVAHGCLLVFLFWRLLRALTDGRIPVQNRMLVLLFSALLPATLYSVAFIMPGEAHDLTAYARELFYLLPLSLLDAPGARAPRRTVSPERVTVCVLLSLLLWHHVVYANQAYMKKDLEKTSTLLLAARIIDRMESVPGYVPGETRVAFVGRLDDNEPLDVPFEPFRDFQQQTGLWHTHAATYNFGRYLTDYLRYPVLWDRESGVTRSELAKAMPAFPAEGSVRMIDGVVVVKLSG